MKHLRWVWPLLIPIVLILGPWGCYVLRAERVLDIAVVDKTVPFEPRVEHRSLFWLVNHLKLVRPDGRRYDRDVDYIGAFPPGRAGDPPERTTSLTIERALQADVVYLADTYGIYEKDLESGWRMKAALERSRKIYGGLEPGEAAAAAAALAAGRVVVAEFNTMASPTGSRARETLERALRVRWTRWAGRYFDRLEGENEVPPWMRDNYLALHDEPWEFQGPGYVLVRDDAWIEVLRIGAEIERIGLTIDRAQPVEPLLAEASDGVPYPYWFDIVAPLDGAEVLAWYNWHLTPEGEDRLDALGLSRQFPAVTRRLARGGGVAYYFSGDFADNPSYDGAMPFAGYLTLRRLTEGNKLAPSESSFYWRFYVPMMRKLLERRARDREPA